MKPGDPEYPEQMHLLREIFFDPKAQDPKRPASVLGSGMYFILFSIIGGIILSLMFLPLLTPMVAAPKVAENYWHSLPSELPEVPLPQKSYIVDEKGRQIAEFFSENRVIVSLGDVSPYVVRALLSVEDSRFYEHNGVDWLGIARAFRSNLQSGSVQEGASTITQQLVKNTLLLAGTTDAERAAATEVTMKRKMEEIHLATVVEQEMTKEEILERYLNVVLFSNGVYGIGTAADYYYDIPASELDLAQSALLVGLLKNPSAYDPISNPKEAKARRAVVLDRMVVTGDITEEEAETAKDTPLNLSLKPSTNGCKASKFPYYCQLAMNELRGDPRLGQTSEERESRLYLGGLTVEVALDRKLQRSIEDVVDSTLGRDNRVAGAIAVVQPGTGKVLGISQNRSWGEGESKKGNLRTQVILPDSGFQPGSAFKPVTLAAALESGFPADATLFAPEVYNPGDMNVPPGGIRNSGRGMTGNMDMVKATAISSNTWYATLQHEVGVLNVAQMARALGLTVPDTIGAKDASFTLGVTDASPLEMSAMYATFAAEGMYCSPTTINEIRDINGVLTGAGENCYQAISPTTAASVTQALEAVIDSDFEGRSGRLADIGRPAGGKTGTTTGHSAAWFVGMTPHLATSVWIGDPRGGFKYPLVGGVRYNGRMVYNVYASNIAAPLWKSAMEVISEPYPKTKFDTSKARSSVGTTAMPDVRGMTTETAVSLLISQGFTVKVEGSVPHVEGVQPGVVVEQTPFGGQRLFTTRGVEVTLRLSSGSEVPDLIKSNK